MKTISHDFSRNSDLAPLARVVNALQAATAPLAVEFFLMGAAARDLWLTHAHGSDIKRQTEDVDFAVMLDDWKAFDTLRERLLAGGAFTGRSGLATHQLLHQPTRLPLDIVPFGGIERADRTIAWPPDQSTVFDCFGAKEALSTSQWIRLPEHASLADSDNLPPPDVIAQEIVDDLEAALEQFRLIASDLNGAGAET